MADVSPFGIAHEFIAGSPRNPGGAVELRLQTVGSRGTNLQGRFPGRSGGSYWLTLLRFPEVAQGTHEEWR